MYVVGVLSLTHIIYGGDFINLLRVREH